MTYTVLLDGIKREISVQEHLDLVLVSDIEIEVLDKKSFLQAVDKYLAQRPMKDLLEI